jgi:uncharacterized Ntn-hydrolase superfamily protein
VTISILAFDEKTGAYGGAAMTGSLCVGGWVLRGTPNRGCRRPRARCPRTLWGTGVLERMRAGRPPRTPWRRSPRRRGRAQRQLAALDPKGGTGHFTGSESVPAAGARAARHVVVAGNMLAGTAVLDAGLEGFLAPVRSGRRACSPRSMRPRGGRGQRGLLSAALLVVAATGRR